MKFIFSLIKIIVSILIILVIFALLINDTFFKENYKTKFMDEEGIPIGKYMYKISSNIVTTGDFITFVDTKTLENKKQEYINKLDLCYGKYYYDKENDITLLNYSIMDNGIYNKVNIRYSYDNYCSDDYLLDDMWVYEYNALSSLVDSTINEVSVISLIDKLNTSPRVVNPIINDEYNSKVNIVLNCAMKDAKYTLEIKDFSENEIIVIKTKNKEKTFGVYEINGASIYLGALK